jgi:hypothetical protein
MARVFLRQTNCSIGRGTVENQNDFKLQVVAVCPSCGLTTDEGPHGTSEECIRALELEIQRLSALVRQVKERRVKKKDS